MVIMVLSILVFAAIYIGIAAGHNKTISMDHPGSGAGEASLCLYIRLPSLPILNLSPISLFLSEKKIA